MRGHIQQRGTNTWRVIAYGGRDPLTGKKQRPSKTVRGTEKEAEEALARLIVELADGSSVTTTATLNELIQRWLSMVADDLSPKTLVEYRGFCKRYVAESIGLLRLDQVTTPLLDRFYVDLKQAGGKCGRALSPATVRKVHVIIRRALGQAVKWGWLPANPAAQATPPRVRSKEVVPPFPEDVVKLLAVAEETDPDFSLFVRLAADTGARRGELCALRWSDFSGDLTSVTIKRALTLAATDDAEASTRTHYVETNTKTHSSRPVSLGSETTKALAHHLAAAKSLLEAAGTTLGGGFVFVGPDLLAPWRPDTVTRRFVRIGRTAGLSSVRLHDLRHYVATHMLALGVPVRTVSGRLGHKNAAVTLVTYGHFIPASDRDAAELLGDLLSRRSPPG